MDRIGIDVGALFLKAVRVNAEGVITASFYERHRGEPASALEEALDRLDVQPDEPVAMTGVNAEMVARTMNVPYRDVTLCQLEAIRRWVPDARYVMDVGGGSATLIQLGEDGKFQNYSTNSLCAAGTGSFLDEQAGRLGISYDETRNYLHNPNPPSIATRCSVFAKSDLIHRQQEGCNRMDMWSGLCRGMTRTLLSTLLNGRPLDGKTVVIGGVALNREVVLWLGEAHPELMFVPERPELAAAYGASFLAERPRKIDLLPVAGEGSNGKLGRFPWPLSMEKSKYPSFQTEESYEDTDRNEVRITRWPAGPSVRVYLGIDIGSTSTKAVLMDEEGEVLADIYRKTAGDPIGATKLLFRAIRSLGERKGAAIEVAGCGTTGSGRKIVGNVIGADAIVNEITAHVAGAVKTDPTIDTIFEIGGQDSKYMHLRDGHIRDANMNYVCAAGTGSFVEEQANKLGYKVSEAGPAVLGIVPPRATDRCTVFMEQDMMKLTQAGATREEAFAAVLVAVTKNYLNKVVGNRYRSRSKIFFQGATARNPALVAAFERNLGVEVVVSPYCHVMGSYGVALITRERMKEEGIARSAFRGLDLEKRDVTFTKETCELCHNHCTITHAHIEGVDEVPSWGYMCGREPAETKMRVTPATRLLRKRLGIFKEAGKGVAVPEGAKVVGIPQALLAWTYLPLYRRFLNRLGCEVRLSGDTTQTIRELGSRLSGADFCFPAKVFLGHAAHLALEKDVDFLFVPHMKNEEENPHTTNTAFCPYQQATPAYTRAALELNGIRDVRILAPRIDLRLSGRRMARVLAEDLSAPLGKSVEEIQAAWDDAIAVFREYERRIRAEGIKVLEEAAAKGEKLLVLTGRPYNLYDKGLNLGLPEKLAEYGRTIVPMDTIPVDLAKLGERYRNTYWGYGQKILAALEEVKRDDRLDAVYFTNFSCGPDSFQLTYASEIMGNKPLLALELDEHGSDTGYVTRIEAFFDVLRRPRKEPSLREPHRKPADELRDRILWIPNMHPFTTELMASAMRKNGYDARALPLETEASFELGRSLTRGSECLPAALTTGSLMTVLRAGGEGRKHAFFMPTAKGPCRFGQYAHLQRQVLDREGFGDVEILSPSGSNGYQGLSEPIRRTIWKAMLVGDCLQKAGCKVRPYEAEAGETNFRLEAELKRMRRVVEEDGDLERELASAMRNLFSVPRKEGPRKPLVGIVGEIYVRNNAYANEHVIASVEKLGAEAWSAPLSEWMLFTNSWFSIREEDVNPTLAKRFRSFLKAKWMASWERRIYAACSPWLDDRHEPELADILRASRKYLPENIGGEAILTLGRAAHFARQEAAMVVNVAPFSCMPGTVTTAIFRRMSGELGMPIVNMFYDGTGGQNRRLEVFLRTAMNADLHGAESAVELPAAAAPRPELWNSRPVLGSARRDPAGREETR